MNQPEFMTKSITIRGVDGNDIRVGETAARQEVVVAIQQNDEHGRMATMRLNKRQLAALCDVKYSLECDDEPQPAAVPEAV